MVAGLIRIGVGDGVLAVVVGLAADGWLRRSQRVVAAVLDHRQVFGRCHHIGIAGHIGAAIGLRNPPVLDDNLIDGRKAGRGSALTFVTVGDAPCNVIFASGGDIGNGYGQRSVVSGRDADIAHGIHRRSVECPIHIIDTVDIMDFGRKYRICTGALVRVAGQCHGNHRINVHRHCHIDCPVGSPAHAIYRIHLINSGLGRWLRM